MSSIVARTAMVAVAILAPYAVRIALARIGAGGGAVQPVRIGLIAAAALSHGMLYLGIAVLFGRSLRPGREALVSRLARRVEPCPTPALLAYARGVTWLWAGFGVAQLGVSALLLATAPLPVWSAFVTVLDAPLVGLVFAAEYTLRRWRFRHMRLASLAETVRAFARRGTAPSWEQARGTAPSWEQARGTAPSWEQARGTAPSWEQARGAAPSWEPSSRAP